MNPYEMGEDPVNQPTEQQPEGSPSPLSTGRGDGEINYPAWAILGGGFLILIGIFLNWFTVSATIAGFSASVSETGTGDWTGIVALIASLVAIGAGGSAILMADPAIRRYALIAGTIAAVIALIVTVIAFFRATSVGIDLPREGQLGSAAIDGTAAIGLYISFLGAVIATVGGALAMRGRGPRA
jgi:hypothetical protein